MSGGLLTDDDLADIIHSSDTIIEVLYADGCPRGFFELTKSAQNNEIELTYFGLMSDYQGLGLGRWFLAFGYPERLEPETGQGDRAHQYAGPSHPPWVFIRKWDFHRLLSAKRP